jgi:hypothetical protein
MHDYILAGLKTNILHPSFFCRALAETSGQLKVEYLQKKGF